jgi:hypothetical protein
MIDWNVKPKPLDVVALVVYAVLAPLAVRDLPFFISCGAEVLLLVAFILASGAYIGVPGKAWLIL